ncbi:hypothetical protein GCM10020331_081710 [Ectobacillus funiculus]
MQTIQSLLSVSIAWFVGKQYDKARFYAEKAKVSEKSYKQLIETIPNAIIIHSQNLILYVNKAGENMLGASKK